MLPFNKTLPDKHIKWVQDLIAALPIPPGQPPPPPIDLQPASDFLTLPAEIRLQIYDCIRDYNDSEATRLQYAPPGFAYQENNLIALAKACRQTRYELLPILWKTMILEVDDIAMVVLRDNHGVFNPLHILNISLAETVLRKLPTRYQVTTVQSLLFCRKIFPNVKKVILRPSMAASLYEERPDPDEFLFKAGVKRELAEGGDEFLQKIHRGNSFLGILGSRIYRAIMLNDTHETPEVDLQIKLQVTIAQRNGGKLKVFLFGDIKVDLSSKQMSWNYWDEQHSLGEFDVDPVDLYVGERMAGRGPASVYIT